MSTEYKLSDGLTVTRWWRGGAFAWTLHDVDTLDARQIAELFELLDPVVGVALLEQARDRREDDE